MWHLFSFMLVLIPSLALAQSVDQKKVGFYMASIAGADCSQATLEAADDNALALGRVLVLHPVDRLGNACQWTISSNLTIDSPLFLPYDTIPVLKVEIGVTLTLAQCPLTWGDYYVIDGNGTTSGTVVFTPGCTQCVTDGDNNFTRCPTAGGSGTGDITDVFNCSTGDCNSIEATDGDLLDLSAIAPSSPSEGIILPQTANCASAISLGQLCVDTDDGTLFLGNDSAAVQVGAAVTLDQAFDNGNEIDNSVCTGSSFRISEGGDDFWEFCIDGNDLPVQRAFCNGAACPREDTIPTNQTYTLHDEEGASNMLIIDPDAATVNEIWGYQTGYQPLVTAEVILRPIGDCTVAEEAIVAADPVDDWITCVDTTGDSVTFNYKITNKIVNDTTVKITLLAVNKNASPSGTFTLDCAAQAVRPDTDSYAAHNTTGEQALSFTTFDTQSRPQEVSATFTLNGTLAVGAHIKGQCDVSAAPAQIADIRLHGTALLEVSADSISD